MVISGQHGSTILKLSPEERLQAAAEELLDVELRDEIADVILCLLRSVPTSVGALLIVRKDRIPRAGAETERGVELEAVPSHPPFRPTIPLCFYALLQGQSFWLGSPPADARATASWCFALGGEPPARLSLCCRSSLRKQDRVLFCYGDNNRSRSRLGTDGKPCDD